MAIDIIFCPLFQGDTEGEQRVGGDGSRGSNWAPPTLVLLPEN